MMLRRRYASLHRRSSVVCPIALAFIVLIGATALAANIETEVVSPKMVRVPAPGGGFRLVPDEAASGQLLVQVAANATMADITAALQKHECSLQQIIPHTPIAVVELPAGMSVTEGVSKLSGEAVIAAAGPDRVMYLQVVPDDPLYAEQYQWNLMDSPAGWDMQTGSSSVVVAVVDTGYDPDHPDLVDKYWVNAAEEAGMPGVDDDGNGYVDDINGWDFWDGDNDPDAAPPPGSTPFVDYFPGAVSHGSHCGGLVGASTNNAEGVAGHDWSCRLMMVRSMGALGYGLSSINMTAVQYAIDNGADVVSCSFGGGFTDMWTPVISNAHAAGVVVVAAAGNESTVFTNDSSTWSSPVCNDGPNLGEDNFVIGVAATDANDLAADFTNRDASDYKLVDVSAPGVDVLSAYYEHPSLPFLDTPYAQMSGTSMSCPITAGLAALVKAQYPSFSVDDIVNQIRRTATDISDENPLTFETLGTGRVNTAAAVGVDVPPEPAKNVQAFDTMNDEGGSITVTWSLSEDDDWDVVQYNVLRAGESDTVPGSPGSFSQIAQVEPGTNFYVNAPVADETPFWYQIVTVDASNSVPSEVAGPAEARDDLPPPAIETLAAVDTQADDGGSISLSWFGYDYPDDLAEYRIYRSLATFTDVAEMEPLATVLPEEGQRYVDDTTEDGTQYWYAVTGVDDHENEEATVEPAGPAVSNPNFAFNYPPGLSIISVGAVPATPASSEIADILGIDGDDNANLAYWDPTMEGGGGYIIYSQRPTASVFNQSLGRAWWLKSDRSLLVNVSGAAAGEGDFQKQVAAGWNMVGNPFVRDLNFAATEVTGVGQGTPISLQTSNQLGYTRDYAWTYDPFQRSYQLITGTELPFTTSTLSKGRGALFLARRPATLILKRPVAPAQVADEEPEPLDGWVLQIAAEAEDVADTDNFLGVSSRAAELNGVISPPRPDADLDLYFVRPASNGARLATDFQEDAGGEWTMRVACAMPGATVRLSWPDLSTLPADIRPVLVDEATGEAVYIRTSTGYTYDVGDEPTERQFTLRIAESDGQPLAICALTAVGGEGGAEIVYTLQRAASVDIEILNIAGRTVRRLLADRQQAAGAQQVTWDGRSSAGSAVPGGTYLVRVVARGPDGQQASAVRCVQLGR
ncbi:MAG: S8 family serine peptidase [Armatimonadota bacterium]|nr:S8 family serine peptidase [Armatimonadota bacterium]